MPTEYAYLVVAANEMYRIHLSAHQAIPGYVDAATIGCNTLRELARDDAFFDDVARLHNAKQAYPSEYKQLLPTPQSLEQGIDDGIDAFNMFLNAERRILIAGGMDEGLVDTLVDEIKNQIAYVNSETLDPADLRLKVSTLRRGACKFADSLRYGYEQPNTFGNIRKLVVAVGGAAMVGINASSLVATIGLSAPAAAISGALGGTLMSIGTTIVIRDYSL